MRIIILAMFILVTSCHNKVTTDASVILMNFTDKQNFKTINDTLNYSYRKTNYKVIVDRYSTKNATHKISGYLSDNPSLYSNYFKFDIQGKLEKYYFMSGDGEHDLYRIVFNSEKREYEEQENAYVDYFAPHNIEDTGNNYTLIFSTFPRKDIDVSYSSDHIHYQKLLLTEPLPFFAEGDIILTKKEVQQGIILKVKTKNLTTELIGIDNGKETIDTLNFEK